MTFPARLTELIDAAKTDPNIGTHTALRKYLGSHAEAIRDLVVAAEEVIQHRDTAASISLIEALDKLEEA